jgi:hypothetical protein
MHPYEKGLTSSDTPGGLQGLIIVSESGLCMVMVEIAGGIILAFAIMAGAAFLMGLWEVLH